MTLFSDLNLIPQLLKAVEAEGYTTPTPIQAQAIPPVAAGRDLVGIAQTGTGKTAAFALPILQRLVQADERPRALRVLVLAPTRELAAQIGASFTTYGKNTRVTNTVIYGGVGQEPQVRALKHGVDVLVATPGRLLDLLNQGHASLNTIRILVLDEADRMLDMGFIHDVRKIISRLPKERQTLLFSATMPTEIVDLSRSILKDPVRVEVTPVSTTAEKVDQSIYFVEKAGKRELLARLLHTDKSMSRVLVFSRTKHGANRIVKDLDRERIGAAAIHGNKGQGAREKALAGFANGEVRVLVATDIAARGIDVEGITHVVNYDLPNIPETYVHRIGRTARAGASGIAISFCDTEERAFLRDIERLTRQPITRANGEPSPRIVSVPPPARPQQQHQQRHPQPQRHAQPQPQRQPQQAQGQPQQQQQRVARPDDDVSSFIAKHRRRGR